MQLSGMIFDVDFNRICREVFLRSLLFSLNTNLIYTAMKTNISKTRTTIFVIFTLFILGSCGVHRAVPGSIEGNNTIVITTHDHPDVAYRKMGQILADRGYSIQNSDRAMGSISTAPTPIKEGWRWEARVTVMVSETESAIISLTGSVRGRHDTYWYRISQSGSRNWDIPDGWGELYEIAKMYEGAEITFETR